MLRDISPSKVNVDDACLTDRQMQMSHRKVMSAADKIGGHASPSRSSLYQPIEEPDQSIDAGHQNKDEGEIVAEQPVKVCEIVQTITDQMEPFQFNNAESEKMLRDLGIQVEQKEGIMVRSG